MNSEGALGYHCRPICREEAKWSSGWLTGMVGPESPAPQRAGPQQVKAHGAGIGFCPQGPRRTQDSEIPHTLDQEASERL